MAGFSVHPDGDFLHLRWQAEHNPQSLPVASFHKSANLAAINAAARNFTPPHVPTWEDALKALKESR